MGQKRDLMGSEKSKIVRCLAEGCSSLEIDKHLKRDHRTIKRFMANSQQSRKKRVGQKRRKITAHELRKMKREVAKMPFATNFAIFQSCNVTGVSKSTRCAILRDMAKVRKAEKKTTMIFMQDNAPSHASNCSTAWLASKGLNDECPDALPAHENCDYDEVCEDSSCQYNEYVTCHLNRCGTCEAVFSGYDNLTVNCNQLTPKCRLMHLEMLHKNRSWRSRPGRNKVEIDNLYDPECEESGAFKAKQCDEDSNLCWCVDSAGVRVTDKTDDDPKCDKLVSVQYVDDFYTLHDCLIQIHFTFKADLALLKGKEEELRRKLIAKVSRFLLKAPQILQVTVHELSHEVTMKLFSTNGTKDPVDTATVAYYIERELKLSKFSVSLDGWILEIDVESIRVLFF
ncbi:unnamed protein product [Ranitomeya imitator]|uniref:Thyroglobulin type-1 domain-containing protein n=1 Tax=Ranitomeya imitator TaxID=111125 RepID=A0ABN9LYD3_9NEOB|nr:unnamed protein product [Ranitomeya imitator]